jgi:hypothetical protein
VLSYRTPGVYFEWLDTSRPAYRLRTDIAGFVGIAARGPLHVPCRVESWTQFVTTFGSHIPQGYLAYGVEGFFANGGAVCYVVRAADPDRARTASLMLTLGNEWPLLQLNAINEGTWAHAMEIAAIPAAGNRYTLVLRTVDGVREIWPNLSAQPGPRYALDVLNNDITGSHLVRASEPSGFLSSTEAHLKLGGDIGRMAGGADGLASLRPEHLSGAEAPPGQTWGLSALELVDPVAIVAMPDLMMRPSPANDAVRKPPVKCDLLDSSPAMSLLTSQRAPIATSTTTTEFAPALESDAIDAIQRDIVAHCEKLQDRVAILDTAPDDIIVEKALERRGRFDTSFAALYYPWVRISDPLLPDGTLRSVPPSGYVAGTYARGDRQVGVHKPPANELIELAQDVADSLDDMAHAELNDRGVNAIRAFPGRGIRAMGARTLSTDPSWRFINVRRLLAMIEESIAEQSDWAVFEPNNPSLWRDLERTARGVLNDLWRKGMLEGEVATSAFSVSCDPSTNPPDQVDLGQASCLIRVQPPLPAEFVVVRLGMTDRGTEFVEAQGVSNA